MKKINSIIMMVAVTILFAFIACSAGDDNKNAMQQQISPEITAYMEIKNALVKDNVQGAQKAAKEMIEQEGVNDAMKNSLGKIAGSADLKEQRKYFSQLSNELYEMVKKSKITDETLYWGHCPMAMDGAGANWLSMSEKISNPYMGQKMPGCGSIKETLND